MKDVRRTEQNILIHFYNTEIKTQKKKKVFHVQDNTKNKTFHTLTCILGDCLGFVHYSCPSQNKKNKKKIKCQRKISLLTTKPYRKLTGHFSQHSHNLLGISGRETGKYELKSWFPGVSRVGYSCLQLHSQLWERVKEATGVFMNMIWSNWTGWKMQFSPYIFNI